MIRATTGTGRQKPARREKETCVPMLTDPWFYAIAAPTIILLGISKGGVAGGLGLLGVPLLSLVVPPLQAAAILLPLLILMDIHGVWEYRRDFDRTNIRQMVPGAIAGTAIAAATAHIVTDDDVRLMVGGISVLFALNAWFSASTRLAARAPGRPSLLRGSFWGAMAGYTSFLAHAGAPPAQVHLLPQRMATRTYVATTVVFFFVTNAIKVPPYIMLGTLDRSTLLTSLVLAPLAPIGMKIGFWTVKAMPAAAFYRLAWWLVFIIGLKLLADGLGLA